MEDRGVYRNIFAKTLKNKYTRINLSHKSSEGSLIAANTHFIALAWEKGKGSIAILDAKKDTECSINQKLIVGHEGNVYDLKFSPFYTDLLASTSDDTTVKLWKIPEEGLKEDKTVEDQVYRGHSIRPCFVEFHPLADDVMASASLDSTLQIWNMIKSEKYTSFQIEKEPQSLDWNEGGSLVGVSTKDRYVQIFDPRTNKLVYSTLIYKKPKPSKFIWVGQNNFCSVGFSNTNYRELKHWDIRMDKETPVEAIKIDENSGIMTPFYDHESKILYITGKAEKFIHTFDFNYEKIKHTFNYQPKDAGIITTMVDRKGVNYNDCEIDKFIKVTKDNSLVYESFYVFRKKYEYDPILYPKVPNGEPCMTYEEWIEGGNKEPIMEEITQRNTNYTTKAYNFDKPEEKEIDLKPEELLRKLQQKLDSLETGITAMKGSISLSLNNLAFEEERAEKLDKRLAKLLKED